MLRPLILMTEAPKKDDAEADPAADDDKKVTTADDPPADDPPADDPPSDDAEGDDTGAADDGADLEDDEDDEDDLGGGDAGDNSLDAGETQSDPVQEQLRRERLYDAIAEAQHQCEQLSASASIIIDRIQDETARKFAIRAKELIDETNQQCSVLRTRFADLGYERVRDLYATARERVSAVAEIIKHVIDGDDDFRKPDSGNPQRNGSTTEQGRGRSE